MPTSKNTAPPTSKQIARGQDCPSYKINSPLPSDILADLADAFSFYDKEGNQCISLNHFYNILQNFGFHSRSKKETDEELTKHDSDFRKKNAVDYAFLEYSVQFRWSKMLGDKEEARDCFKLFDKNDKESINAGQLKQVLSNYLEFPVSDNDIKDFVSECGGQPDGTGQVNLFGFSKLYLS